MSTNLKVFWLSRFGTARTAVYRDEQDKNKVTGTEVLYTNYSSISISEVAKSNAYWATKTLDADLCKAVQQDLRLTFEHLSNHIEEALLGKVLDTYYEYSRAEQGGPLLFASMMSHLQDNSAETAEFLLNTLEKLKVTDFQGENINKLVSLARGAIKRLEQLIDRKGKFSELFECCPMLVCP